MSPIVQFLIALLGLGVAIDYSLIVVSRWREERSHGRSGDEAVQKAMETAGRAVVFSGITVAIGLLALIALPLPFLRSMGYGGMLIPLVSTLVAITLLPVVLAKVGSRLDWPHRRTDDKASRAWTRWAEMVARRRWLAAGVGHGDRAGAGVRRHRPAARRVRRQHRREVGRRPRRPGRARGRRHRRGRAAARTRSWSRAAAIRTRWRRAVAAVDGIHGAVGAGRARVAPRRDRARRGRSRSRTAAPRRARTRSTAVREAAHAVGPGRARRRAARVERGLHRRRLRQLPADDRADHDHAPSSCWRGRSARCSCRRRRSCSTSSAWPPPGACWCSCGSTATGRS